MSYPFITRKSDMELHRGPAQITEVTFPDQYSVAPGWKTYRGLFRGPQAIQEGYYHVIVEFRLTDRYGAPYRRWFYVKNYTWDGHGWRTPYGTRPIPEVLYYAGPIVPEGG